MAINTQQLRVLTAATCFLILVVDLSIPLGVAGGVPYVAVVLLSLWLPGKRTTAWLAVICTLLTAIGYFLSPAGGELAKVLANRFLAIFAIWVTAILAASQKKANEDIRQKSSRLNAILEANVDGILTADARGVVESFNPAAERIFAIDRSEIIGQSILKLIPEAVRDRAEGQILHWEDLWGRQLAPMVVEGARVDGTTFPMELSISSVQIDGQPLFAAIIRDISEKRRLEGKFLQAQKLEAVGRFSSGIAHDFNNLIMGILGVTSIARDKLGSKNAASEELDSIELAANDGARLTRQLLDFSRNEKVRDESIDLDVVLQEQEGLFSQLVGEDVELLVHADSGVLIRGDQTQLRQILMNLLSNSRDALPEGGTIEIRTSLQQPDGDDHHSKVTLRVTDNGIGMSKQVLEHALDPFFTTKEEGKGTGLGLSTIYGIVSGSGGTLDVASEPGKGTTVTICWPIAGQAPESGRNAQNDQSLLPEEKIAESCPDTVLVVEDEDLVRMSVRYYLEKAGYQVFDAADAAAALELASQDIDILLSDMVLPGKSGSELAAELRTKGITPKALFMSAWPRDVLLEQGRITEEQATLQKPFTREGLLEALESIRNTVN